MSHAPETAVALRLILARVTNNVEAEDAILDDETGCAACLIDGLIAAADLIAGMAVADDETAVLLVQDALEIVLDDAAAGYTLETPPGDVEDWCRELQPGDFVKLIFVPNDPGYIPESMWVQVKTVDYPTFVGALNSQPSQPGAFGIDSGDPVDFHAEHILVCRNGAAT